MSNIVKTRFINYNNNMVNSMKLIKNKKGFAMVETIVVMVMVTIILLRVFSSFANTLSREKTRVYYDDTAYIFKLYAIADFLKVNNINPEKLTQLADENYIVPIGIATDKLFENMSDDEIRKFKVGFTDLTESYGLEHLLLVKPDFGLWMGTVQYGITLCSDTYIGKRSNKTDRDYRNKASNLHIDGVSVDLIAKKINRNEYCSNALYDLPKELRTYIKTINGNCADNYILVGSFKSFSETNKSARYYAWVYSPFEYNKPDSCYTR